MSVKPTSTNGLKIICATAGVALVAFACVSYYRDYFHWPFFIAWLAGLGATAWAFYSNKERDTAIDFSRQDLINIVILSVMASITFLYAIYIAPFALSGDENCMIRYEQFWNAKGINDLFGLSDYFGFPYFSFLVVAKVGEALGGITLYHQRLVHGLMGAGIVIFSYAFYRAIGLKRDQAFIAATIMCFSHSLVGISRLAFRDNICLFLELPALALLFRGITRNSFLCTFLGACFAGVEWYGYFPGRIVAPLSILYLGVLFLFQRPRFGFAHLFKHGLVYALAFLMTIGPLAMSYKRDKQLAEISARYQHIAWLWYPEGLQMAKDSTLTTTAPDAIVMNAVYGLTTFNNTLSDHGWKYCNHGNGFVDPLSGILLWLGFFSAMACIASQAGPALVLSGFVALLGSFSLLVSQTPNYTRLLVLMPFSVYLITGGLDLVAKLTSRLVAGKKRTVIRFEVRAFLLLLVCLWNTGIYVGYACLGIVDGDPEGAVARYLEARKTQTNHLYLMVNETGGRVFDKTRTQNWQDGSTPFKVKEQVVLYCAPSDCVTVKLQPPFTFFMCVRAWKKYRSQLQSMYPHLKLHELCEYSGLVAVEDDRQIATSRQAYADALMRLNEIRLDLAANNFKRVRQMCLAREKEKYGTDFGSDCAAQLYLYLGAAESNDGNNKQALPHLARALALRQSFLDLADPTSLRYIDDLGDCYARMGDIATAAKLYRQELDMANLVARGDLCSPPPPHYALSTLKLASALAHLGKRAEAMALLENFQDGPPKFTMKTLRDCAFSAIAAKDFAQAQHLLQKATLLPVDSCDELAQVHADLGYCHLQVKEYAAAADEYALALNAGTPECPRRPEWLRDLRYNKDLDRRQIENARAPSKQN